MHSAHTQRCHERKAYTSPATALDTCSSSRQHDGSLAKTHTRAAIPRMAYTRGMNGEEQSALWSCASPVLAPRIRLYLAPWAVIGCQKRMKTVTQERRGLM